MQVVVELVTNRFSISDLSPAWGLRGDLAPWLGKDDPQAAISSLERPWVHSLDFACASSHANWSHSCPTVCLESLKWGEETRRERLKQ